MEYIKRGSKEDREGTEMMQNGVFFMFINQEYQKAIRRVKRRKLRKEDKERMLWSVHNDFKEMKRRLFHEDFIEFRSNKKMAIEFLKDDTTINLFA